VAGYSNGVGGNIRIRYSFQQHNQKAERQGGDIGILQVVLDDGVVEHIKPTEVEDKFSTSMYARSQLQKLLDATPVEYAEMVLNDELGRYVELCNAKDGELSNNLNGYFEKHCPDATKSEVNSMTREFMMYDS